MHSGAELLKWGFNQHACTVYCIVTSTSLDPHPICSSCCLLLLSAEATSGVGENRDPKRIRVDREGEDHGTYPSKHPLLSPRPNNNLNPAPGAGPISSAQLMYSYNGSSPLSHSSTNSHHLLDTLRRLPPPLSPPPPSSNSSSLPLPRTPDRHTLLYRWRPHLAPRLAPS